MTATLLLAAGMIIVAYVIVFVARRTLRQRADARRWRAVFMAKADDLIGKEDFPEAHAKQLVILASIPPGWITRVMVFSLFKQILTGRPLFSRAHGPELEQVPSHLREHYAVAILSLALSDSYRCAILGRIWRGSYSWVPAAVNEIKPDVNAHATRTVVSQINRTHGPRSHQPQHAFA